MNYVKADEYLGKKLNRPIGTGRATRLVRNSGVPGDYIHLKLHDTYVITWMQNGDVMLNSGGWRTVTTKARINEHLNSGFGVSQERGQWYVTRSGERVAVFDDGVMIHPDGTVTNGLPLEAIDAKLKLRRSVNKFATDYAAAFGRGEVHKPSNGDCWMCLFQTEDGKSIGDGDHLLSHIEEKYYVPSLLVRAINATPTSIAFKQSVYAYWEDETVHTFFKRDDEWFLSQMKRAISKYMLRQLGQAA